MSNSADEYLKTKVFPVLLPAIEALLKTVKKQSMTSNFSNRPKEESNIIHSNPNDDIATAISLTHENDLQTNGNGNGKPNNRLHNNNNNLGYGYIDPIIWLAHYLYRYNPRRPSLPANLHLPSVDLLTELTNSAIRARIVKDGKVNKVPVIASIVEKSDIAAFHASLPGEPIEPEPNNINHNRS